MAYRSCFLGACATVGLLTSVGCGSSSKYERQPDSDSTQSDPGGGAPYRPGSRLVGGADEPSGDEVSIAQEKGVLETTDVEDVLEQHVPAFTACYGRAGNAQRYVEGQVLLRIFVAGDGSVSDVHIVENSLGNYAIESCLADEARAIAFPAPQGGKPTDLEYPLQFRSTREIAVTEWPSTSTLPQIAEALATLRPCVPLSAAPVETVLYIEPSGAVGSAGFVSAKPIEREAATCVTERMRTWRLAGEPGHVLRTRFDLVVPPKGLATLSAKARAKPRKPLRGRRGSARR